MASIQDLRESIDEKVYACLRRLEEAQVAYSLAAHSVEVAQHAYDEVKAEAASKLSAISLVESMLEEANRAEGKLPYENMIQEDAMRAVLIQANRFMNSTDLAEALKAGGYQFTSSDPPNSIVVAANTNRKKYFRIEKEGRRTLIGLEIWTPPGAEDAEDAFWVGDAERNNV